MKPNGLLVAVGVLAVLSGLVWFSNKKQAQKKPADTATKIISIPDDQFKGVRIKTIAGTTIDLARENGKWTMTQPKPLPADQDAVSALVTTLSSLDADKKVEDKAADLHAYGLDIPTLDVTITKKDGKSEQLLIGNSTLDSSGYYGKLGNDPRVFTIATYVKNSLDKPADEFRDKRLLTFDAEKLSRVDLTAKGGTVEFGKNGENEWQIVKPRPQRADGSQVSSLVDKLKDAKMETAETGPDTSAKFGSAAKVATASVTDASGTQTLEIRKDKDNNYYAKSSVIEGVWRTSADVGDALNKGLDDFRNKKLFDFGFNDPNKIELKGATYTKSGDKWMSGAKTMDNSTVQTLIDKLRDLSAAKFAEKGGGEPVFAAAVTSNDAKRIEKVTVTKQGAQYFATREKEPSVYELDSNTVGDLQKAAADIKEAAPPAKKK